MFELNAGVVNVAPVNIGAPPLAVVYQLNTAPAVVDAALITAVWPDEICALDGVTVKVGATGVGLTTTSVFALVELTQLPVAAST
jgi:hypothetical protein